MSTADDCPPPSGTPTTARAGGTRSSGTSPACTPSRSTTSRCAPATRSRRAAACWSPRRPAPARRSWASSPIHLALATGRKCFYTTPIKALSNQKYHDLVERYGPDQVGLLTGDNVVNGEAPVVVMTTEVLRNMLYAGSRTLLGLGYVVMDEVHYLADRSRGAVWEEVIIHLPESVALVSLSATVSNAEEFGEWLADRARRHHHDRGGAAPGAALPARDGRQAAARPVRVLRRRRRGRLRQGGRPGQRRAAARSPATTGPAAG